MRHLDERYGLEPLSGEFLSPLESWCVVAGSAHPELAERIAALSGLSIYYIKLERFPDGEVKPWVEISLEGKGTVIVQPTSPPVNDHLMELILLIEACLNAGAEKVIAAIPYFGYARQCKRRNRGEPLSARVVANLIGKAGAKAILTVDMHEPRILDQLAISIVNVRVEDAIAQAISDAFPAVFKPVIVAPDEGGAERAQRVSEFLGVPFAVLKKRREYPGQEVHAVVKECSIGTLKGRQAIIVDDMVTTGNTLAAAARALRREGAKVLGAVCTHGVLTPHAAKRLAEAHLPRLIVSDSLPLPSSPPFLQRFSVAPLLADAITQLLRGRR